MLTEISPDRNLVFERQGLPSWPAGPASLSFTSPPTFPLDYRNETAFPLDPQLGDRDPATRLVVVIKSRSRFHLSMIAH